MIKYNEIEKDEDRVLGHDKLGNPIKFGDVVVHNGTWTSYIGIAYGVTKANNLRTLEICIDYFNPNGQCTTDVFSPGTRGRMMIKIPNTEVSNMVTPDLFEKLMQARQSLIEVKNSKS